MKGLDRVGAALVMCVLAWPCAVAQVAPDYVVERSDGPTMTVPLSGSIALNRTSTLKRQRLTVNDPAAPAALTVADGVDVAYQASRGAGEYVYVLNWGAKAKVPLVAIEVRALVFDVFGRHLSTMSAHEIGDVAAGDTWQETSRWRIPRESEAEAAHQSVVVIWRARTAAGQVYAISMPQLSAALKKAGLAISDGQLELRDGPGR